MCKFGYSRNSGETLSPCPIINCFIMFIVFEKYLRQKLKSRTRNAEVWPIKNPQIFNLAHSSQTIYFLKMYLKNIIDTQEIRVMIPDNSIKKVFIGIGRLWLPPAT